MKCRRLVVDDGTERVLEVLRTEDTDVGTASPTGLASPTRCSSHLHHIAFDDDRPVIEQPVRSALHDNLDRDAIYRCDALIESSTTVPGLRHMSPKLRSCVERDSSGRAALRQAAFPFGRAKLPYAEPGFPIKEPAGFYVALKEMVPYALGLPLCPRFPLWLYLTLEPLNKTQNCRKMSLRSASLATSPINGPIG